MNIFIVDSDPYVAAKSLCGKHCVKMPEETGNMLLWQVKRAGIELPKTTQGVTKKLSHENHPCTVWLSASRANYIWGLKHFGALLEEYWLRYDKTHFAQTYHSIIMPNIDRILDSISQDRTPETTPFPRCFGEHKESLSKIIDTVSAYRAYYHTKAHFAKWPSINDVPAWWNPDPAMHVDPSFKNGSYIKRGAKKQGLRKQYNDTI